MMLCISSYSTVMPTYPSESAQTQIEALSLQIHELKAQLYQLKRELEPTEVRDYRFQSADGEVSLSTLFGDRDDLVVIHNMGEQCSYCTAWADGFSGLAHYLDDRAAFCVVSPDSPADQARFAESRGWKFRMVSDPSPSEFTRDLGFWNPDEGYWPGASGFRRRPDGTLVRVAQAVFGPMDDFCPIWPLFELLEGGVGDWEPRYLPPRR